LCLLPELLAVPFDLLNGCRKVLDLVKIQDRGGALADYRCPLAFLNWQNHRSQNCGVQFHRAVICQDDELFVVQCHRGMPAIWAGQQDQHTHPDAQFADRPAWLKFDLSLVRCFRIRAGLTHQDTAAAHRITENRAEALARYDKKRGTWSHDLEVVEATRARFRPDRITTLFVGESDPDGGDFFYFGGNAMLHHTQRAIEHFARRGRRLQREVLPGKVPHGYFSAWGSPAMRSRWATFFAGLMSSLLSVTTASADAAADQDTTPVLQCEDLPPSVSIAVMSWSETKKVCREMARVLEGVRREDITNFEKAIYILHAKGYEGENTQIASELVEIIRLRGLYDKPDRWYDTNDIVVKTWNAFNGAVKPASDHLVPPVCRASSRQKPFR
jgi:hypothetical protein